MKKGIYFVALLITLTTLPLSAAGIQKWVDKDGKVHYGDRSPVGETSKQVHIDSAPSGSGSDNSLSPVSGTLRKVYLDPTPGGGRYILLPADNITGQAHIGSAPSSNGLRPEEVKRLRRAESQNNQKKYNRRMQAQRTASNKRSERANTRSRCSQLDSSYTHGSYKNRGNIVSQQRKLGCR